MPASQPPPKISANSPDLPLLTAVRRFCDATGMPVTLFGRRSIGDPRLVGDLIKGREPRSRIRQRIEAFICSNRNYHHPIKENRRVR